MSDPRNFVASSPFSCEREGGRYHLHGAWADWPEVVAFAEAILKADHRWQKSWRSVDCDHRHAREGDKFCASCGAKLEVKK
jgi:hypothetical protein